MPNLTPNDVISAIRKHMIGDGFEFVIDLGASRGCWMRDQLTGRDILDFYSCFASNPVGFNHPNMSDDQTRETLMVGAIHNITNSDLFTEIKARFVSTFYEKAAPSSLSHMFLIAGGALAVENALKASFDWKQQLNRQRGETRNLGTKVMHLRGAFHGRTGYTLSLTNTDPSKTERFPTFDWPRIDNPSVVFPDQGENRESLIRREQMALDQAKNAIHRYGPDIAAFIFEPIQGEGGDNHFRAEFLREMQNLCNENDIMFIVDEIQTGMGMTGKMWGFEHLGVEPDMLCFGKKTQVCGFLCSDKIDCVEHNVFNTSGRINSTWGGNLVDMTRCVRYLEIIEEDRLIDHAQTTGKFLLDGLRRVQDRHPNLISNARGRGLMCAFDLPTPEARNRLRRTLFERGVLILGCGSRTIRFRPALTISESDLQTGLDIIDQALTDIS